MGRQCVPATGSVCFNGDEVHFIANPDPTTTGTARVGDSPASGVSPDGSPAAAR